MAQIIVPDNELNSFDLPPVCVITGSTQGVVFKPVKFSWYPRWVGALILINVMVMAIVAAIMTKRVKGELPFTEEAYAAWRKGRLFFWVSLFLAICLFAGSIGAFASDLPILGLVVVVASIALPIGVWVAFLKGKNVTCNRIADGRTTLKIPSEAAAIRIKTHLSGERPSRPAVASGMR